MNQRMKIRAHILGVAGQFRTAELAGEMCWPESEVRMVCRAMERHGEVSKRSAEGRVFWVPTGHVYGAVIEFEGKTRVRKAGSGVIAGKIEVGRGLVSRWGGREWD